VVCVVAILGVVRIVVLGAGRVGTAVAVLLGRAGHQIAAVSGREGTRERAATWLPGVPVLDASEAAALGELVLVAVPDDLIAQTVSGVAGALHRGQWVAHLSGAARLDILTPARDAGARRLAVHPLQTFPDVERAIDALSGCTVAVSADDEDGYALGEALARDLGAAPFRLADELRPLYHAAAVFASNYLVVTSAIAERLFTDVGVPDPVAAMHPLQRATLANIARLGPHAALTGPAVRGDAGTVARNLESLAAHAPETVPVYVAMCRAALGVGVEGGRLAPDARAAVDEVLDRWS
jgi:predicted short-subunit dehydrogenase-like oxidoreductase (DUF2520 family)